jgi:protein TonB
MALVLAAGAIGAAGDEARETPLFELVPVPPEYAPAPTPTPTPAAKHKAKARPGPVVRKRSPPSPPPAPVYTMVPTAPVQVPVAAPPPMPQPPGSRVRPRGSPGSWVTSDDYPAGAIRGNMQGTVRFTLDVDSTGRVSACRVGKSSGWPVLDDTTCALLRRRARFLAATDDAGVPIAATYTNRFRWEMGFDRVSPMASWARVTRFAVNKRGEIMGCFTNLFGAPSPIETQRCDAGQQPDEDALYAIMSGAGESGSIDLVELHRPVGAPLPAGFTMPEGAVAASYAVQFTVSEDGYVRGCDAGVGDHPDYVRRYVDDCAPEWTYPAAAGTDDRLVTMRVSLVHK